MKRFHVHTKVRDLATSIRFYTQLFGIAPSRVEADYAKWMIEDPRLNFAISTRGEGLGVDHLGIQAEDEAELAELKSRAHGAQQAEGAMRDDGSTTCCYARSEKHWVTDPQGVAWEHFQTLADIPVFSAASTSCEPKARPSACC